MSLLAATVVATSAMFGGVHFDADAQGRAVLAWDGWRGGRFVTRTVDVRDGRPAGRVHELWREASSAVVELSDMDVSPAGAAVACLRERSDNLRRAWRVRIVRRAPDRSWSPPILVADPHTWVEDVSCGTADDGRVVLAWTGWRGRAKRSVYAASVAPDGGLEPAVRLGTDAVGEPQVVVAADGTATVSFTVESRERVLRLSRRPAGGGWTTATVAPADSARLSIDGAGRAVLGWTSGDATRHDVRVAGGTAFAPVTVASEPGIVLAGLAAGTRGDVLAAWEAYEAGASRLRVSVQRPGEPFGAPVTLGRFGAYPLSLVVASDGSGAAGWVAGSPRRPRNLYRRLGGDGRWSAARPLPASDAQLVATPGERLAAAWVAKRGHREALRVGALP